MLRLVFVKRERELQRVQRYEAQRDAARKRGDTDKAKRAEKSVQKFGMWYLQDSIYETLDVTGETATEVLEHWRVLGSERDPDRFREDLIRRYELNPGSLIFDDEILEAVVAAAPDELRLDGEEEDEDTRHYYAVGGALVRWRNYEAELLRDHKWIQYEDFNWVLYGLEISEAEAHKWATLQGADLDGWTDLDADPLVFHPGTFNARMPSESVTLNASQREQLQTFLEEHGHTGQIDLRPSRNLPECYVEAVLIDADGEPIAQARILFPSGYLDAEENDTWVLPDTPADHPEPSTDKEAKEFLDRFWNRQKQYQEKKDPPPPSP